MLRWLILAATHAGMLGIGFALGVYFLPILTAPKSPEATELQAAARGAQYSAKFRRDLKGSDPLHWGEGDVHVGRKQIVHMGRLAPGPDYKLYLAKSFVETKEGFLAIKAQSRRIADIETFSGFIAEVPEGLNVDDFNTVVVWCEAFSQFISAARYR
jgi:hypothetical protein